MIKNKYLIRSILSFVAVAGLSSCLGNDDDDSFDYEAWRNKNETYLAEKEAETGADGRKLFERVTPVWAPGVYVLAQWHNDRSLTAGNLIPMDNSTVDVVYDCSYIDGTVLDSSAKLTANGDSIYRCKPSDNIVGFWTMLTNMHVGDSVTCVIPTAAAYGASSSSVIPYSTLIYHMKLKAIHRYEMANN